MKPVYLTNRGDVSNWLAFVPPRYSQYVLFDGGLSRETNSGFWSLDTGEEVLGIADSFINTLPPVPMAGYLTEDSLHVTGFPTIEQAKLYSGPSSVDVIDVGGDQGITALSAFISSGNILNGDTCHFIAVRPLPSDRLAARDVLVSMGIDALAMSPISIWIETRSWGLVTTKRPGTTRVCRVREINELDFELWYTPGESRKMPFIYQDDLLDGSPLKVHGVITAYVDDNTIIGYE